jgi:hypothetical protein
MRQPTIDQRPLPSACGFAISSPRIFRNRDPITAQPKKSAGSAKISVPHFPRSQSPPTPVTPRIETRQTSPVTSQSHRIDAPALLATLTFWGDRPPARRRACTDPIIALPPYGPIWRSPFFWPAPWRPPSHWSARLPLSKMVGQSRRSPSSLPSASMPSCSCLVASADAAFKDKLPSSVQSPS